MRNSDRIDFIPILRVHFSGDDGENRLILLGSNSGGRNRSGGRGRSSNKYDSTEWLDANITSLSDVGGGGDANNANAAAALSNKKITNLLANLPEDMRISKLLRSLCGEKDAEAAKKLCSKLNIVILDSANANYIRRSFDILADTMMRVFKDGPTGAMGDIADVFGKMGWVVRTDFNVYRSWVQRMYKHERIREWIMRSLEHTLQLDAKSCDIRADACQRIIEMLKEYLENIEKPSHFIAITNAIQRFSQNYPKQFQPHFADIVDFVIGWHLETDQLISIKDHCSSILQTFKPFWLSDVTFTRNLLSQFLEDIVSFRDEVEKPSSGRDSPDICVGSIVGATNSILKCIYDSSAILCQHLGIELLKELLCNVLDIVELIVDEKRYSRREIDLIHMNANELIVIVLDCRKFGVEMPDEILVKMLGRQLAQLQPHIASDQMCLTVLFTIKQLVSEMKTSIPLDFVEKIFGRDRRSPMHQLKFSHNRRIHKSIIKIYQTVLNVKNVELLQLAYRLTMDDLIVAQQTIADVANTTYTFAEAECIIAFHLITLSTIAISNSSIIVMWALEPTIFELLTDRLQTADYDDLWVRSPETYYGILTLLISHCINNNNFIGSSALLNAGMTAVTDVFSKLCVDEPTASSGEFIPGATSFNVTAAAITSSSTASDSSPTKFHFEMILKFLERILRQKRLNERHHLLVLDWCDQLIKQSTQFSHTLKTHAEFTQILFAINHLSSDVNASVAIQLKCADCIDALHAFDTLHTDIFALIAETCCIQMCSSVAKVRDRFSYIFARLPLNVSLKEVNQFTGVAKARQRQINNIQHWHSRTTHQLRGGEMRSQYFVDFIRAIKISEGKARNGDAVAPANQHLVEQILQNIFIHSWNKASSPTAPKEIDEFGSMAAIDIRVVISWAQWEAAQFCVNNKLRTALGKPQETFLKIESIIKENARILALKDKMMVPSIDTILSNQRHARILLGFMEALEKCIYNASEGTAVALPPAEKPARTFFHVNAITCNEWFVFIFYQHSTLRRINSLFKLRLQVFSHSNCRRFGSVALHGTRNGDTLHRRRSQEFGGDRKDQRTHIRAHAHVTCLGTAAELRKRCTLWTFHVGKNSDQSEIFMGENGGR